MESEEKNEQRSEQLIETEGGLKEHERRRNWEQKKGC